MNNQIKLISVLASMPFLVGCIAIDLETDFVSDLTVHNQIIDQSSDGFPEIDPLLLTDEMKQFVDEHVRSRDMDSNKVNTLQEIMFEEEYLNIQYQGLGTGTALKVFESQIGNCLSVMGLYVSLARYVGLDANFQTVANQPSWDMQGDLLVLSQHINATGSLGGRLRYVVDFTPEIALQQMTSRSISDRQARALYFNNLGVEALIAEDLGQALVYFKNALWLDQDLSIGWNNIGTTYNRSGNSELAEYSYKMAFSLDRSNATAINNLARFYDSQGDRARGNEYRRAIERFNNQNPYFHYAQGNLAFVENNYNQARISFHRAVRLKEDEPEFHLALANIYQLIGDDDTALSFTRSAEELLSNDEIYRPSDQKVRFIDPDTILRSSSPRLSIYPRGSPRFEPR